MFNLVRLVVFSLMIIAFSSCGSDDNQKLEVVFKATYNGSPLVMFDMYEYADTEIFFSTADFYVSKLSYTTKSGELRELSDVEFVDFTAENTDPDVAARGLSFTFSDVIGEDGIENISFGIGVDSENNTKKPSEFNSGNPLSKTGHYWEAWDSYIHMKLQGQYDETGDASFPLSFLFHTGTDALYRQFSSLANPVQTDDGYTIEVSIDFQKLFEMQNGQVFDIPASPLNHDPNNIAPMQFVADNLEKAINVN